MQFDRDLRRRAVAAKTLKAYAIDGAQFAAWASANELAPRQVDVRALRRYAASLTARGQAPATVARKLAALRGMFRAQVELGERAENPAELVSSPKKRQRLPRVLKAGEVAALLDRIPATTPLELRDRSMFELAYASGLRAEELVTLEIESIDFDSEAVRVEGKGGKTRLVPAGEHALSALERYLARGRPNLAAGQTRALFLWCPAAALAHPTSAGGSGGGRASHPRARRRSPGPIRTRCATRSRPICSKAERTCGRSRSCSGTPASRRPRFTLG